MKQLASFSIAVAAVAVLVLLFIAPVITVAAAQPASDAPQGQQVFLAQKCDTCHAVPTAAIQAKTSSDKMKGPDLVNLPLEAATLEAYLTQQGELDGKKHKKAVKAGDDELDALISWLLAQKR